MFALEIETSQVPSNLKLNTQKEIISRERLQDFNNKTQLRLLLFIYMTNQ